MSLRKSIVTRVAVVTFVLVFVGFCASALIKRFSAQTDNSINSNTYTLGVRVIEEGTPGFGVIQPISRDFADEEVHSENGYFLITYEKNLDIEPERSEIALGNLYYLSYNSNKSFVIPIIADPGDINEPLYLKGGRSEIVVNITGDTVVVKKWEGNALTDITDQGLLDAQ